MEPERSAQGTAVEPVALTISAFCQATGVGRSKVYQELKFGRLRGVKVGRRTLILVSELSAWLGGLERYKPQTPDAKAGPPNQPPLRRPGRPNTG